MELRLQGRGNGVVDVDVADGQRREGVEVGVKQYLYIVHYPQ